ncbi:hypothetical protein KKD72_03040 [Patescibacteria group bacterium]|nr:hypothetical protein [Patescibacteria group bacterium]
MKRNYLLVILAVLIFLAGCAGVFRKPAEVVNIPPGGIAVLNSIPSPRAGLVLAVNQTEGAWARCSLYEGDRSWGDIIGIGSDGNPILNDQPLAKFEVGSAATRDFWSYKTLVLQPYRRYTLFIIWTRFTGQVLGFDEIRFRTSGNPFQDSFTDGIGRKTFADKILYLPSVNTRGISRLRIDKTLYLGDWIKALFGLP